MSDQWQWWRSAVAAVEAGRPVPACTEFPESGYYRMRRGDEMVPVAIWRDSDGSTHCIVGADQMPEDESKVWSWCSKRPVRQQAAKAAFAGQRWPDEAPPIGDNSAGALDLTTAEKIEHLADHATKWLARTPIAGKLTADQAAEMRLRLNALVKEGDAERTAEKEPHRKAAEAVDAKWRGPLDAGCAAADALRRAVSAWMAAEEAKRRAEAEAARNAAAEAAAKLQAEAAAKGAPAPVELPLAPPPPPKVQAGGYSGRKTGLRSVWRAEITDYRKALDHYAEHPDIAAVLRKLADAAARAGKATTSVPGIKAIEERVAV